MVEILLYILSNFFDVCVCGGGGLFIEPAFFLVGGIFGDQNSIVFWENVLKMPHYFQFYFYLRAKLKK